MPRQSQKSSSAYSKKARKTFTLSRAAVDFLEAEKLKRGTESASSVLEELINDYKTQRSSGRSAAAITNYYDSLTDQDREEAQLWGKFAEGQFPVE